MQGLLQDWVDIEGTGNGEVVQSGAKWPNLDGYQDVIFWLEVRMVTSVATELRIHYLRLSTAYQSEISDRFLGVRCQIADVG